MVKTLFITLILIISTASLKLPEGSCGYFKGNQKGIGVKGYESGSILVCRVDTDTYCYTTDTSLYCVKVKKK